jgi:O-acetyl-ADP-ribose deacetylase (regulator of RNase III)
VVTTAGNLSAQYVIHTVGPVWNDDEKDPQAFIQLLYQFFKLAESLESKPLLFPISVQEFIDFPRIAGKIAVDEVRNFSQITRRKLFLYALMMKMKKFIKPFKPSLLRINKICALVAIKHSVQNKI